MNLFDRVHPEALGPGIPFLSVCDGLKGEAGQVNHQVVLLSPGYVRRIHILNTMDVHSGHGQLVIVTTGRLVPGRQARPPLLGHMAVGTIKVEGLDAAGGLPEKAVHHLVDPSVMIMNSTAECRASSPTVLKIRIQIILPECDQIINLHTKKCPPKVKENHKTLEQKGLFWVLIFLNVKSCIADLYYCKVLTFLFYVSF